jgi:cytochrome c-type biogenesis protein CcsB
LKDRGQSKKGRGNKIKIHIRNYINCTRHQRRARKIMSLQNDLANYSFLSLLGSMILYWVSTLFGEERSSTLQKPEVSQSPMGQSNRAKPPIGLIEDPLFAPVNEGLQNPTVPSKAILLDSVFNEIQLDKKKEEAGLGKALYALASQERIAHSLQNWFAIQNLARYGIIVSNILLGLLLILRWKESGHFPLSNLYESLMFLSWCFTGLYLFIDLGSDLLEPSPFSAPLQNSNSIGDKNSKIYSLSLSKNTRQLLGAITTPSALLTNAFATFTLPKEMQEATPLVPALQSNWLMMHVTVMVLSYAALILGSLLSIAFLIVTAFVESNKEESEGKSIHSSSRFLEYRKIFNESLRTRTFGAQGAKKSKIFESKGAKLKEYQKTTTLPLFNSNPYWMDSPLAITLDNLSYRILGIGFPFLTIGILSGAVWANEAWGSYWSWDPKETWALLTWLIFAIYLHTRLSKGWEGKKPAIIASLGFVIVWICYLGVNLIGEGLHSYGWLSST